MDKKLATPDSGSQSWRSDASFSCLPDALRARSECGRGLTIVDGSGADGHYSYARLLADALSRLGQLQAGGLSPGDELVVLVDRHWEFIVTFWACLLGGIVAVPVASGNGEEQRKRLFNIWRTLKRPHLAVNASELQRLQPIWQEPQWREVGAGMLRGMILLEESGSPDQPGQIQRVRPADTAFIQFSSGSTGMPKGIVLSHDNLLTNCRAMIRGLGGTLDERLLCWMPMTHDMGLIGFHITPIVAGWDHYLMPTEVFIRQPGLWLRKLSQYRITLTASPNFGYKYVLKYVKSAGSEPLDLSTVRLIFNGAEPISADICRQFLARMASFGLKENTMFPVYGMAEASLAVTFPIPGEELQIASLDRRWLGVGNRIADIALAGMDFVQVGRSVDDCEVRIVDEQGLNLNEDVVGHIQIRGANVTAGYYGYAAHDPALFSADGWLKTGDLGFIRGGGLYVTGRAKDIVFVNGQNVYPHDIELVAEGCAGIESNKIAVGGYSDPDLQFERIIAFVQYRGKLADFIPLAQRLRAHINMHCGVLLTDIVPVARIPKTTSGKVQRFRLVEEFRLGQWREEAQHVRCALDNAAQVGETGQPENETEAKISEIWENVLQRRNVGITEHFLALGGSSLLAAQVVNRIMAEFSVSLTLETFFKTPTIRELAACVTAASKTQPDHIARASEDRYYPLSFAQRRLYVLHRITPESVAYNLPQVVHINGELEVERLWDAFRRLIQRHESLRTTFELKDGRPVQIIHDHAEFVPEYEALASSSTLASSLAAFTRPFDLRQAPLIRARLNRCAPDHHVMFFDIHHIIADGASLHRLFNELTLLYGGAKLPELRLRFRDYTVWEEKRQNESPLLAQEAFWSAEFSQLPSALDLPLDRERPKMREFTGANEVFTLSAEMSAGLKRLCATLDVTPFAMFLALLNVLLGRFGRQEDVVIGCPVYCRPHVDLEGIVGMFVNTLALRNFPSAQRSFSEFVGGVQQRAHHALAHQEYPFEKLVEKTGASLDPGRNPLFDVMLVLEDVRPAGPVIPGLELLLLDHNPGTAKFDLTFFVAEKTAGFEVKIEYASQLFLPATIARFKSSFIELVQTVLAEPDRRVGDIVLLPEADKIWLESAWHQPVAAAASKATLHGLFGACAAANGERTALRYRSTVVSYRELDERSDQLAQVLCNSGVRPGALVAILLNRSVELVVSILAILKTGAAYVPLDPEYPDERIAYILEDCQATVMIAAARYRPRLGESCRIIDPVSALPLSGARVALPQGAPDHPAYVIYTSGSSGRPKGVVVPHAGAVNYVLWAIQQYVRDETANFPLFTSIAFDLTVTSLFAPLLSGNAVVIYGQDDSATLLQQVLTEDCVDVIKLTPSHLKLVLHAGHVPVRLKRFIVGGENLERRVADQVHRHFSGRVEILNEYGPTETVVGCMIHRYDPHADSRPSVPIGRCADNVRIYLLDQVGQLAPLGMWGEMYIAGLSMADGYLNKPELTASSFVPDRFAGRGLMFKTGDLARFLPAGSMEFGGRVDQQIKIRGYRIEPAEVKLQLKRHPAVREVAVVAHTDLDGVNRLIAGVVPVAGMNVTGADIRHFLADKLPNYMIPGSFVFMDKLPLSAHGKIDQRKLVAAAELSHAVEAAHERPVGSMETALATVWSEVLNQNPVGRQDNFYDLGGDSIKAVQIAARLKEQGIDLQVRDLFQLQTLARVAETLRSAEQAVRHRELVEGDKQPSAIESWFLSQDLLVSGHFNQSVLLRVARSVDQEMLAQALETVVRHHDGLRLNCHWEEKKLFFNADHLTKPFRLITTGVRYSPDSLDDAVMYLQIEYGGFNLAQDLLLKALVLPGDDNVDGVLLIAHHLLVDGVSWRILLEDIQRCLDALQSGAAPALPPKTASLLEWLDHQRAFFTSAVLQRELPYWRETMASPFKLPVDNIVQSHTYDDVTSVSGVLGADETELLLQRSHRVFNTGIQVMLLTALAKSVREWTSQGDQLLELENHGRQLENIDVSRTVGWFTALFPFRLRLDAGAIADQIVTIKEQFAAMPNHGLGYGWLRQQGQIEGPIGGLAEVRFNYLGQFPQADEDAPVVAIEAASPADIAAANPVSARVEMNCLISGNHFKYQIRYNRNEFNRTTIEDFACRFSAHLSEIVACLKSEDSHYFSPSDFVAAGLDQDDLATLLK